MKNLIFLKLGGALITDKGKAFQEKINTIKRLAREIHRARKKKKITLIIGNGGGSYPHTPAKKYRTAEGIINKKSIEGIAKVQDAAARLNRIIVKELLKVKEMAISIQPSAISLGKNGRIGEIYTKTIKVFLSLGMVPVLYGDVIFDKEKGCAIASTEEIFFALAKRIKPKKIIFAEDVAGVFEGNPHLNPKAKLIKKISQKNFSKIKKMISGSRGIDVTGGMIAKVKKCLEIGKLGIPSFIVSGKVKNRIEKILLGEKVEGTIIS